MTPLDLAQRKLASAKHAYQDGGLSNALFETVRRLAKGPAAEPEEDELVKHPLDLIVYPEDVLGIDWHHLRTRRTKSKSPGEPLHVAWVMSPPTASSGGHQNIFRFISFLEAAGHECTVHLHSNRDFRTVSEVEVEMQRNYQRTNAPIRRFDGDFQGADAVFATGWETCYPMARHLKDEKGLYFVQDFEPMFFPTGSSSVLAENTYRMNLFGVTAGDWLAHKLPEEYGMRAASFPFAADTEFYDLTQPTSSEGGVFFYARPGTPRRGFELGVLALTELHRRSPDTAIHLAGWDVSNMQIPFPHVEHGALSLDDLPAVYNLCDVALVLSFSNLSLLPLELLSCGVVPVMNEGPNTEMVCTNPNAVFTAADPYGIASALEKALATNTSPDDRMRLRSSVDGRGWAASGEAFVAAVEGHCYTVDES